MAAGDFFNTMAEGIFSRLAEKRDEQKKIEEDERSRTLNLLTSLASQVEPESFPVLMKHIGKVAGMKGDVGSFWQGLSGMPNTSLSGKIGTAFNQAMAGLVGPETARKNRSLAAFTKGFTPQTPEQAENIEMYQEAARYPDRMVLRDPRAEQLEDLRTRYGLQFSQRQALQDRRDEAIAKRAQDNDERDFRNRMAIEVKKSEIKSLQAQNTLASEIFTASGGTITLPDAQIKAANMLVGKSQAELDVLLARGPYLKDLAAKARMETEFMRNPPPGVPKGMKPGEAARLGQGAQRIEQSERRIGQAQQQQGQALYKQWSDARAAVVAAEEKLNSAVAEASSAFPGKKFDPKTRALIDVKTGQPMPGSAYAITKQLSDMSAAEAAIKAGRSKMGTIGTDLLTRFPDYYEIGIDNPDPGRREINPKKSFGGVAPGTAPRVTPTQPGAAQPAAPKTPTPTKGFNKGVGLGTTRKAPRVPPPTVPDKTEVMPPGTDPSAGVGGAPAGGGAPSYRGTASQRWDDPKFKQNPNGSFPKFEVNGQVIEVTGTQPPTKGNPYGRIFYRPSQR